MAAPDDSVEIDNLTEKTTVVDDDLIVLGDDEDPTQFLLKKLKAQNLKLYILDQTTQVPFLSSLDGNGFVQTGGKFYPISGLSDVAGVGTRKAAESIMPRDGTFRNFTVDIIANQAGTSSQNKVTFLVNGSIVDTILIPEGSGTPVITSSNVINVNKNDNLAYEIFLNGADGSKITVNAISINLDVPAVGIPVGVSTALLTSNIASTVEDKVNLNQFDITGDGISDTGTVGVYELSANLFELTASLAISAAGDSSLDAQWETSDTEGGSFAKVGVSSNVIGVDDAVGDSSAPICTAYVDARKKTVFVRLVTQDRTGVLPTIKTLGTWGKITGVGFNAPPPQITWAASDEDSSFGAGGLQYVTEVGLTTRVLSEVKISLKNAPTGSIIQIDIEKETDPNSNTFATIFSTKPQIEVDEFFNTNSIVTPVFSQNVWEADTRLRILITAVDSNDAASGLKVTLA